MKKQTNQQDPWKARLYREFPQHQAEAFERESNWFDQMLAEAYRKSHSEATKRGIALAKARKNAAN